MLSYVHQLVATFYVASGWFYLELFPRNQQPTAAVNEALERSKVVNYNNELKDTKTLFRAESFDHVSY